LAFVIWLIWTSQSFEKCQVERQNHESYAPTQEKISFPVNIIVKLRLQLTCARVTLGDNDGAIVALATIVLAIFTWALWRSTEKLWLADQEGRADTMESIRQARRAAEAAEIAAQAALGIELPRLELECVSLRATADPFTASAIAYGSVVVSLKNYGRTPAHLLETQVGFCTDYYLPAVPKYGPSARKPAELGAVVLPRQVKSFDLSGRFTINFDGARSIAADEMDLWVYGFVGFRDFLGGRWRSKFCVRYAPIKGSPSFVIYDNNPAYSGHERYQPQPFNDR
jgi:hypothetical protein